jgi:hypothetical protein
MQQHIHACAVDLGDLGEIKHDAGPVASEERRHFAEKVSDLSRLQLQGQLLDRYASLRCHSFIDLLRIYGQISLPDEAEMLMLCEPMPEALGVGRLSPFASDLFCRAIIKPDSKRGIIGNRIQAGEGFDKNIPSQLLRGVYIFRDPQTQGIDSPGVLMIESGKRLPVARFRAG